LGGRRCLLEGCKRNCAGEAAAVTEAAIERPDADAGGRRDILERNLRATFDEQVPSGGEQLLFVAARVGTTGRKGSTSYACQVWVNQSGEWRLAGIQFSPLAEG
jgi:hypothetical protein